MKRSEILTEEILTLLAYGLDLLACPTFRDWDQSYEGWLSRNGMLRRMQYLEGQKFLLREGTSAAWVYRLTESGRDRVLGECDPVSRWNRPWDGWWRQFVFDLPVQHQRARHSLLRWLRRRGFGYLQDSVWISPDPVDDLAKALAPFRDDVESFTVLESRCAAGFSNSALVEGAWPVSTINERYKEYQLFADQARRRMQSCRLHPKELFALLREERERWSAAYAMDPLLPRKLWTSNYEGERAMERRRALLSQLPAQVKGKTKSGR